MFMGAIENGDGSGKYREAWKESKHASGFGTWDKLSTGRLVRVCDQFNEIQLFRTLADNRDCRSISDIGCATGRFFRFFQKVRPDLEYKGFDISETAIEYARNLYPRGDFTVFNGSLTEEPRIQSDIVFCRDVVIHQAEPREFLSDLYDVTKRYLILRLRTRETGDTVFDIPQSCQYVYGHWVPYMVFNTAELIDLIRSFSPTPSKITLWRWPDVLGGQNNRFVPKEMYYPETGTAETALIIEKGTGGGGNDTVVNIETHHETRGNTITSWATELRRVARRLGI